MCLKRRSFVVVALCMVVVVVVFFVVVVFCFLIRALSSFVEHISVAFYCSFVTVSVRQFSRKKIFRSSHVCAV